jgi:hypothetical protein
MVILRPLSGRSSIGAPPTPVRSSVIPSGCLARYVRLA